MKFKTERTYYDGATCNSLQNLVYAEKCLQQYSLQKKFLRRKTSTVKKGLQTEMLTTKHKNITDKSVFQFLTF